ncbi:MAG TPA: hypothetical protein VHS58_12025, partial [Acetobacteraceae bacterium]|nr:hypothetical protein [Acetobacteraceae bacterium]
MRAHSRIFRLAGDVAIGALLFTQIAPPPARAQAGLPQLPGAAAPSPDQADVNPPDRVGTLARMTGTVSFHAADQTQWSPATLNYPVTSGSSFWTQPQSTAEIDVGATQIGLNETTELDITTLDQQALVATLAQGEMYLDVRYVADGEIYRVETPRGEVAITMAGQYGITAGSESTPTLVTVLHGAAHIGGGAISLNVGPNQTAVLTGTDQFSGQVGAAQVSPFLQQLLDRGRPAQIGVSYTPPPVVQQMSGSSALMGVGQWSQTSDYGEVWYPPVQQDWAPYRDGH